jgi:hypothetical protein
VGWVRILVALFAGLSLLAPAGTGRPGSGLPAGSFRPVSSEGVSSLLPPKWEVRPLRSAPEERRRGLQASGTVPGRMPADIRHPGLEAYWVDATGVGVPSDYYRLAARGPSQDLLRSPGCYRDDRRVVRSPRDVVATGQYVATSTGTCTVSGSVRWASFVAAPGFGPVRSLGIPRSGLYVVRASVSDGPDADRRLRTLMNGVAFGGTPVRTFLTTAGLPAKLP